MQKRNVLIGAALTALLVTGGALTASAATLGPEPTTPGGGRLYLTTEQYSMETIDVLATYSKALYPDTVIDIQATDEANGAVVSTSHMDNNTWVRERVLNNFKFGHTYDISATLSWKDGSNAPVTSASVSQKMVFTDTVKTLTFKTLNQDVPLASLSGTVYRAEIRHATATDPRAYAQPGNVKIAASKASKTSRVIKWNAASINGGWDIKNYKVTIREGSRTIVSKTVSASAARSIKVSGLKKNVLYKAEVRASNIAGNGSTSSTFFTR